MSNHIPKWHRELELFAKIKPLIILEGNVLDSYQFPVDGSTPRGSILRLPEYLHFFFKDMGYTNVVFYDSLRGFYNSCDPKAIESFSKLIDAKVNGTVSFKNVGRDQSAPSMIRTALTQNRESTVVTMNFASRYITNPNGMDQSEVDSFTILLQSSLDAKDIAASNGTLKNLLIIIVNKINDLPTWFYLQNPNVKSITLSVPSKDERAALVKGENFASFFNRSIYKAEIDHYDQNADELTKIQDRFVALTDEFSFTELNSLRRLCKNERVHIKDLCDVVDLYKYGIRENPWKQLDVEKIRSAKAAFDRRVKGQDHAITKTLDVIKRAVTGMAGLQGSSHTRPKGVLFFAGPTGTGKTETAKTLAEILFGDENCCIRFDMSEYAQPHSDQKLLGAPPGYVGYEAGGQLTNAVKKNPFSILLFDEIEKAHPSILDKFLQILEDGRMTDGQGNTAYFSESIIVFTSNLGIYTVNEHGRRELNVKPGMNYDEMSERVRSAIEDHFKIDLGRPEILNRIGENIVVFDFIGEEVADKILRAQIEKIVASLAADRHIDITLTDEVYATLLKHAVGNLSNGGRGIGNVVESLFINPLARYLFDNEIADGTILRIDEIIIDAAASDLRCTKLDQQRSPIGLSKY